MGSKCGLYPHSKFWTSLNGSLSLRLLSKELATLLALTSLLRVSELAAISFSSIFISEQAAKFSLAKPRRSQHTGMLRSFVLKRFPNSILCPVAGLATYINSSTKLRNESNKEMLFICVNKPNKPAKPGTIGGWIKSFF